MIGLVGLAAGGLFEIRRLARGNKGGGNNDAQERELRKAVEVSRRSRGRGSRDFEAVADL